ncbi:MAG: hypothetical protein ABJB93_07525 [Gaiellales bacterium]
MTHTQSAPRVVLSADTTTAAVPRGAAVELVELATGARRRIELPDHAEVLALSPDGAWLAAGAGHVTVVDCAHGPRTLAHTRVDPPLRRIAVGRGLVVGLSGSESESMLRAWSGDPFELFAAGPSWEGVAAEGLALDSEHARAVVWGLQGEKADLGEGERFVRLCAVGAGTVSELWTGEGAPAEPNGFLLPLDGGSLGVYDEDGLVVIAAGEWQPSGHMAWGNIETAVASPDGSHVAWVGADADDRTRVRVAEVESGTLVCDAVMPSVALPVLAVSDAGRAVVAFGELPDTVRTFAVVDGRVEPLAVVDLTA